MSSRGFTLIEMLLSIALITLLVGLSLPIYQSFQSRSDLVSTEQSVIETLRRAETFARANQGDSQWGVNFQSGVVTLFKGTTYAGRTSGFDETLTIASNISFSYAGDIVFAKLTGKPGATLSQIITSSSLNSSRTVTVNTKGTVDG